MGNREAKEALKKYDLEMFSELIKINDELEAYVFHEKENLVMRIKFIYQQIKNNNYHLNLEK